MLFRISLTRTRQMVKLTSSDGKDNGKTIAEAVAHASCSNDHGYQRQLCVYRHPGHLCREISDDVKQTSLIHCVGSCLR